MATTVVCVALQIDSFSLRPLVGRILLLVLIRII
nr:MAG TPA: hypothetical protein [Caudoviricetes sp.]